MVINNNSMLGRLWRKPLAKFCLGGLLVLVLLALFAPLIAPYHYRYQDLEHVREYPSDAHWFGTDQLGRDILSRMLYGMRVSLAIGFVVVTLEVIVGVVLGLTAGYFGGWWDSIVMRLADLTYAFPGLLLVIFIVGILGREIVWLFAAFVILGWPSITRLVRAQVLSIRKRDYILACHALGLPHWRILAYHILPNCAGPVVVAASISAGGLILAEAGLSFLGLGVQPPYPSLGSMISDLAQLLKPRPLLLFFPSALLSFTVLLLNLLGDSLRDALDVR